MDDVHTNFQSNSYAGNVYFTFGKEKLCEKSFLTSYKKGELFV